MEQVPLTLRKISVPVFPVDPDDGNGSEERTEENSGAHRDDIHNKPSSFVFFHH